MNIFIAFDKLQIHCHVLPDRVPMVENVLILERPASVATAVLIFLEQTAQVKTIQLLRIQFSSL